MLRNGLLIVAIAALCYIGNAQDCGRTISCGECINLAGCVWCTDLNFTVSSRCIAEGAVNASGCVVIENPSGSLGAATPSGSGNPISLRNIEVNLRVGQPQQFTVAVTALRNLPLDLYLLMDLSSSMGPVLVSVQEISDQITDRVQNITNNVRLAFGSFNDKNLPPFTNLAGPITEEAPYSFLHRVDFTPNTTTFSEAIGTARVTRNIDAAENTLEALAQVVSCEDVLRWRTRTETQVARLVLVLTDQGFHYSGEGKFAGILNPYLGNCLMQRSGNLLPLQFTEFAAVDYPSVGQFVELIRDNDVNVIFAVPPSLMATYQELVSFTNGRATTSTLNVNGAASEILDTIENEYRELLRDITLRSLSTSNQVTVEIASECPAGSSVRPDGDGCAGVQLEDSAMFTVTLTLNNCDGLDNGESQMLTLDSGAFGTFNVIVNGVCNCGCEADQVPNSNRCNGNGAFSCGVCVCNEGYCGLNCELEAAEGTGPASCMRGGATFFNEVCSGRGFCNCECQCEGDTFGMACECDTSSPQCKANLADSEVCSGRGTCCDRMCTCHTSELGNPFRGDLGIEACQCPPVEEVCNYLGVSCNDRGSCLCDSCDCISNWEGSFCEIPTEAECGLPIDMACITECYPMTGDFTGVCTTPMCNIHRPTIIADLADASNADIESIATAALGSNYTLVRSAGTNEPFVCTEQFVTNCDYTYYIMRNGTNIALVVDSQIICTIVALSIPIYVIGLIALGVVIGLVVLIIIFIKIIFIILDYVEVKKWQRETQTADFSKNQNPLYQSPETKYTNVMYGKAL